MAFVAGISATERIGDFGLIGGGAAGWEIDRADHALGTPPHALVVATATQFSSVYHWVKEELTHTHSANTGETCRSCAVIWCSTKLPTVVPCSPPAPLPGPGLWLTTVPEQCLTPD